MAERYFVCSSDTERNNGKVKSCNMRFKFNEFMTPHCPICSAQMVPEYEGLSISELLQKGLLEENNKKERI